MGDSEVDKCHPRTHVRGELNLGKEKLGGRGLEEGEKEGEKEGGGKDKEERKGGRTREKK